VAAIPTPIIDSASGLADSTTTGDLKDTILHVTPNNFALIKIYTSKPDSATTLKEKFTSGNISKMKELH
jgi:hypothetical protein